MWQVQRPYMCQARHQWVRLDPLSQAWNSRNYFLLQATDSPNVSLLRRTGSPNDALPEEMSKDGRNLALEGWKNYLRTVLVDGDLRNHDGLREIIELALDCGDPEALLEVAPYVRMQRVGKRLQIEEPGELFREPKPSQLRGDCFVGATKPNGYPAFLRKDSFGGRGHVQIGGITGCGKSIMANFLTVQLASRGIPTLVIDQTGQVAEILLRHLRHALYLDFDCYRRNLLLGPKGVTQQKWLQIAGNHLRHPLDLPPIMWRTLLKKSAQILRRGRVVTIPALIEALTSSDNSERGLLNRLISLEDSTGQTFKCEYGFELEKIFSHPSIFNLHGVDHNLQRLIIFDLLAFYMHSHPALPKWQLRNVLVIHETAEFVRKGRENRFFFKAVRECRNFGLGLVLLSQSVHAADTAILSNIQTRCLFSLTDERGVDAVKIQLGLTMQQRNVLMNLPRRVMLVKRPDLDPFLVRVPNLL